MNKSPLRYPGGKTKACTILEDIVLQYFDLGNFSTIISPFFGGGSFEFFLQNKYNLAISANDKFTPLTVFWKQCLENSAELCREIEKELGQVTKERFLLYRDLIMDCPSEIRQAVMFFILNRCSFSGATLSGGFSLQAAEKRFTRSSIEKIRQLQLNKFSVQNVDFQQFIETQQDGLMFVDPPYYLERNSKLYGKRGNLHEAFPHMELFEILSKRKNWILTYNDCEFVRDLYKDNIIVQVKWNYGMNKSKQSSEIVIVKQS